MSLRSSVLFTLGLVLLAHAPAHAKSSAGERRSLVLRGRASDAQGFPIAKAKITAVAGTTLSVKADDSGQYTLTLPLVTMDELARRPYTATVRCESRGWHFAVASIGSQLGLDVRIVAGADTVTRLVARSNDVRVAAAAARAMSDGSGTPTVVTVNFIAEPGELVSDRQAPDLTEIAQLALPSARSPSVNAPVPTLAHSDVPPARGGPTSVPAPAARPTPPPASDAAPSHEVTPSHEVAPAPAKAAGERAKKSSGSWWSRVMGDKPEPPGAENADVKKALEESKREQRSIAREEAKRLRDESKDRERALRQQRAEEKLDAQRRLREVTTPDSSQVARRRREAEARAEAERRKTEEATAEQRWKALVHDVNLVAGASDTVPSPPLSQLTRAAGEAAPPNARAKKAPSRAVRAARDTVVSRAPRPLPEPIAAATPPSVTRTPATTPASEVARPPAAVPSLAPAPAPEAPARAVKIYPPPEGQSRARAAPLVIRASGGPVPRRAEPQPDSCVCRIEGTVEVDSPNPLSSRLRVVVALAWYPAASDTVELFMGSPRPFQLPPVPCGAQRLKVTILSRDPFVVSSREALSGFRCDGGSVRQIRLVLAPH